MEYNTLKYFRNSREERYRAIVVKFSVIAFFEEGNYFSYFKLIGENTGSEALIYYAGN